MASISDGASQIYVGNAVDSSASSVVPENPLTGSDRRLRREQRSAARDLARRRLIENLAPLLEEKPPDCFSVEQVNAYIAELHRLYQRSAPPPLARARGPA